MISWIPLDANQENSRRSTGSHDTSLTKHITLTHSMTSLTALPSGEDKGAFEELLSEVRDRLAPDGAIEMELVDQIVFAFWRIRRCRNIDKTFVEKNSSLNNSASNGKDVDWASVFGNEFMDKLTKYENNAINQVGRLFNTLTAFRNMKP